MIIKIALCKIASIWCEETNISIIQWKRKLMKWHIIIIRRIKMDGKYELQINLVHEYTTASPV